MAQLDLTPRRSRALRVRDVAFRANRSARGFESLSEEVGRRPLTLLGQVPSWLRGRFLRTGPALFEVGDEAYRHWFDGLAMLYRFGIGEAGVDFTCRFLDSHAYRAAMANHGLEIGEFGTEPHRGPIEAVRTLVFGPSARTDNCNVNVARIGERFVAMTETPNILTFDPETLETLGPLERDDLDGSLSTAHPHHDPTRHRWYNYVTVFGRKSTYRVHSISPGDARRTLLAEIPAPRPAYMHSFGASEDYLLLFEFPLVMTPLELRFSLAAFRESFRWRPELGTRIKVIAKDTGAVVAEHVAAPMFGFHHVNAHRDGDEIVADLITYEDGGAIEDLALENLRSPRPPYAAGTLERVRIPLAPRRGILDSEVLSDLPLELPRINPAASTRRHRFVYATTKVDPATFFDALAKVDVETGSTKVWREGGIFVNEPVFVPNPDGNGAEDDGVVLSVGLDAERQEGLLLVLDARTMTELARAYTGVVIPFHFHGSFYFDDRVVS